jgi:hypothetical protein
MNYDFTQVFVPTNKNVTTGLGYDALTARVFGVFTPTYVANTDQLVGFQSVNYTTGAPTPSTTQPFKEIVLAMGTGTSFPATKFGSFKSPVIRKGKVSQVSFVPAENPSVTRQQVTYIGFDEVNDFKSPAFACDEEYVLTLKIDEYWSKGVFQPLIQESVRVKTVSCTECGGGCDALNCYDYIQELVRQVNANPLLSKYVTATHVFKGTAPTFKYTLTVPDTFGSGAAATYITSTLQPYYPSGTYGTITLTADADGADDANTTGNTMFEIATPLIANVNDMPPFNGILWERQAVTAGSVTACGIKLEGKALDAFGNACVPDAVPYVFNLVRFQAKVHKGPFNTQDFDIDDVQTPWAITKTQDIKYPIGVGSAMAEMERHYFRNNLPNVAESVYYWNPIYNEDVNQFLYVNSTLLYHVLSIKFLDDAPVGFEKKSVNSHEVMILVDTASETANSVISSAGTVSANILAFFNYFTA